MDSRGQEKGTSKTQTKGANYLQRMWSEQNTCKSKELIIFGTSKLLFRGRGPLCGFLLGPMQKKEEDKKNFLLPPITSL